MFAEMRLLGSVKHPTGRVCCHHLHHAHIEPKKSVTLGALPLHSARFLKTGKGLLATNFPQKCVGIAVCRASLGQEISEFEEREAGAEFQLDSSVFEEVYPRVERVKRPVGTRVRGVPVPQSTLVPDDWKDVQQYLHRSKKERKQETLARQLEWAKRRALEDRLTREEMKKERFRLREEELVVSGADLSPASVLLNEAGDVDQDLEMVVEPAQNSVSGRARPKDFRSELQLTSVEEIAETLIREEEAESGRQVEAERIRKESEDSQAQALAVGEKKHLLTPEENAMLKSKKLNLARVSSSRWSPLHTLAASGQVYLGTELLKKGVDLDAVDVDGLTPLHRAVHSGRKTMVRLLLRAGANAHVLDNNGATLLHYSAQIGDLSISKVLLRHGVDVNISDADGWTPLHVAVQSGRLDLVKTLVYRGADLDIANKDGNTALDLALSFGATFNLYDAIKFLKKMSVSDSVSTSANNEDDDGDDDDEAS